MLNVYFQGWWQDRMASDPDPSDEPRGVSGPTFACPGEPDLDRVIRLQHPVAPRYPHESDIGVNVYRVTVDDPTQPDGQRDLPNHPLLGGQVDLLDGAKFDERNFVVLYQKMPIVPFHLQVSSPGTGIVIERVDLFDITQPNLAFAEICEQNPEALSRRTITVVANSPVTAEATGILNYAAYRRERKEQLQRMLSSETDAVRRAALIKRIRNLAKDDEGMPGTTLPAQVFLGLCGTYSFAINGPGQVQDPHGLLGATIGLSQDWPLTFWMGGYDVDTMTGYMRGVLSIPQWAAPG